MKMPDYLLKLRKEWSNFLNPPLTETFVDDDILAHGRWGRKALIIGFAAIFALMIYMERCAPDIEAACDVICESHGEKLSDTNGFIRVNCNCYLPGPSDQYIERPMIRLP